jgi:hypothetical protein
MPPGARATETLLSRVDLDLQSARPRSRRAGHVVRVRSLSTLVYTPCGLQRDLIARSRTPAGMVHLSARRAPDRSSGPPTLVLSGGQGRARPFRVRTPYRGRRVALRRAGAGSVRGDGAEAQPAAGSSLSGEPSQGAVGAPLADAIRQAQPDAGSEAAAPGTAGGKVALPDTELVAKLSKDNKAVGVVAVAIGVGAVVGAREVRRPGIAGLRVFSEACCCLTSIRAVITAGGDQLDTHDCQPPWAMVSLDRPGVGRRAARKPMRGAARRPWRSCGAGRASAGAGQGAAGRSGAPEGAARHLRAQRERMGAGPAGRPGALPRQFGLIPAGDLLPVHASQRTLQPELCAVV